MNDSSDGSSERVMLAAGGFLEARSMNPGALELIKACLVARLNLAVSGPSEVCNRSLLQALVSLLPAEEQVLAIQNPDEPSFAGEGITTLRAHLSIDEAEQIISREYLLTLAPKMHPHRLLLDTVRPSEAFPLVKLLFTMGGVIFSIIAESPDDALRNLESMLLANEGGWDTSMMRRVLSTSLDLIIQTQQPQGGSARIANLTEVSQAEDRTIVLRDIFRCQEVDQESEEPRHLLRPTGIVPQFNHRLEVLGISLPLDTYG